MIDTSKSLLDQLRTDNAHDAWSEFYHLYWRVILRYVRKLGLSQQEAEDVLQETMVTLMRLLPDFTYDRRKGRFRNFLLTIVHRKCLAVLRRSRRERESQTTWIGAASSDSAASFAADAAVEPEALNNWRVALLAEALRELRTDPTLDEHTFAVFAAYAIEKRPVDEVAARFGLRENAVYQVKNRMMRRLQARVTQLMQASGT